MKEEILNHALQQVTGLQPPNGYLAPCNVNLSLGMYHWDTALCFEKYCYILHGNKVSSVFNSYLTEVQAAVPPLSKAMLDIYKGK